MSNFPSSPGPSRPLSPAFGAPRFEPSTGANSQARADAAATPDPQAQSLDTAIAPSAAAAMEAEIDDENAAAAVAHHLQSRNRALEGLDQFVARAGRPSVKRQRTDSEPALHALQIDRTRFKSSPGRPLTRPLGGLDADTQSQVASYLTPREVAWLGLLNRSQANLMLLKGLVDLVFNSTNDLRPYVEKMAQSTEPFGVVTLDLSKAAGVTAEDLDFLRFAPLLAKLDLGFPAGGGVLAALWPVARGLRELSVSNYALEQGDGRHLAEMSGLKELLLRYCTFATDDVLCQVCPSVEYLAVSGADFRSTDGMRHLEKLQTLDMDECRALASLDGLRDKKDLRYFSAVACELLDTPQFLCLSSSVGLTHFLIAGCSVDDELLPLIARLQHLIELDVRGTGVRSTQGLPPSLQTVHMHGNVNLADLEVQLPELDQLHLQGGEPDLGFVPYQVANLHLEGCEELTDEDLLLLAENENLAQLELTDCDGVTEQGVDALQLLRLQLKIVY